MPKANKSNAGTKKGKVYAMPTASKKRDLGVPKIQTAKLAGRQAMPYGKSKPMPSSQLATSSINALASSSRLQPDFLMADTSENPYEPIDASLTTRDSSAKAFLRELRKVIERSDVIIQVLDARDPEGTRSRWVEEEVRKRDGSGKKLLGVMNKIDLVPRANLEAWLKYLRHSFPCMPFKSSTQAQRQHLSQNAVPLSQTTPTVPGQIATPLAPLPTTSSSLGAPALLHLLKQYALSTPHSALTVGVVGYPNVGKSSLINSLKRSRACGVAAMPGKTRVVQEVVLDKGVKILDCPGVVLEDFGREMEGEEGRKRQAEIMLRNCVKAELVEDPIAPAEVILSKVDPALLQKLYGIPPYDDIRDFLIKLALTRGRLGKGGIPDLTGSAVSVLRDWNSGKIPYSTVPPTIHPSSAPAASTGEDVAMSGEAVGNAQILNTLSEAFTLEGLLDDIGDEAAWEGEDAAEGEAMAEDAELLADQPMPTVSISSAFPPALPTSDDEEEDDDDDDDFPLPPTRALSTLTRTTQTTTTTIPLVPRNPQLAPSTKLFTPEELAVLPDGMLSRQKQKQQAKKAKKRRMATEQTEGALMLGFMDMGVEEPEMGVDEVEGDEMEVERPSNKKVKRDKKKRAQARAKGLSGGKKGEGMEVDEDAKKEADFASFLAGVGGDDEDEEL